MPFCWFCHEVLIIMIMKSWRYLDRQFTFVSRAISFRLIKTVTSKIGSYNSNPTVKVIDGGVHFCLLTDFGASKAIIITVNLEWSGMLNQLQCQNITKREPNCFDLSKLTVIRTFQQRTPGFLFFLHKKNLKGLSFYKYDSACVYCFSTDLVNFGRLRANREPNEAVILVIVHFSMKKKWRHVVMSE